MRSLVSVPRMLYSSFSQAATPQSGTYSWILYEDGGHITLLAPQSHTPCAQLLKSFSQSPFIDPSSSFTLPSNSSDSPKQKGTLFNKQTNASNTQQTILISLNEIVQI